MRIYENPPFFRDNELWKDTLFELLDVLESVDQYEDRYQEAIKKVSLRRKTIDFLQKELMRLFPKYAPIAGEKRPKILGDCDWWNGIEEFSILAPVVNEQGEEVVTLIVKSYVGGGKYDHKEVSITLPKELSGSISQ